MYSATLIKIVSDRNREITGEDIFTVDVDGILGFEFMQENPNILRIKGIKEGKQFSFGYPLTSMDSFYWE